MKTAEPKLNGLGDYLVAKGYLEKKQALFALQESIHKNIPFLQYLSQSHSFDFGVIAKSIAEYFGLPFIDLEQYTLNHLPIEILPADYILKNIVLPLEKQENQMILAVADPTPVDINELNFITGMNCALVIVEANKLNHILQIVFSKKIQSDLIENFEPDKDFSQINENEITQINIQEISSQQSPIVKILNAILLDAISRAASDIHFEPCEKDYRIRFRIDGVLYDMYRQPKHIGNYFIARLKVLANLDISERRVPQDGRLSLKLPNHRKIDFRLNTCPAFYGERSALRIQQAALFLDTQALGMNNDQLSAFHHALSYSQGMILVTGPTGAGKTMTLYSALDKLNSTQVNILTIEDPIEIHLQGINQVQINDKVGFDFTTALRAFLRQDPDIIMVGEIRDSLSAEIAIKAAQTGHLVLSTLHTNNTAQSFARLLSMGTTPFTIGTTLLLVIAQRLVRKLCPHCKQIAKLPKSVLFSEGFHVDEIQRLTIFKAKGCANCHYGYKGRAGIYEVVPISDNISQLILQNANAFELAHQIKKDHILTLRQSGLEKVKEGLTSLNELNRVIKA